ncbi:MAG: Sapep family Mn(2+)-dependent dipeptidase [Eubacteriales bacterium]
MLDALRGLLQIPSVTGAPAVDHPKYGFLPYGLDVYRALQYTLQLCECLGFTTHNCENMLGYAEIGNGETMIGILTHLDVVPAGEGWVVPPFDLTEEGETLWGRGILDDKGPLILILSAMKSLLEQKIPLNKRIRVIFACQEESGDWADIEHYKTHYELPHYGFTPDADFPVIYGEKGILQLALQFPLEGSGFRSLQGGIALNMVPDQAQGVTEDGITHHATGVSAHGSMPERGENAISNLFADLGATPFGAWYQERFAHNLDGGLLGFPCTTEENGLTLNVGRIYSDSTHITMELDIRHPSIFSHTSLCDILTQEVAKQKGTLRILSVNPPSFTPLDSPLIAQLMEAYRSITHDNSPPTIIGGGTYARAMDGIVAFGPILPGRSCTEHANPESMLRSDWDTTQEIYIQAFKNLLQE